METTMNHKDAWKVVIEHEAHLKGAIHNALWNVSPADRADALTDIQIECVERLARGEFDEARGTIKKFIGTVAWSRCKDRAKYNSYRQHDNFDGEDRDDDSTSPADTVTDGLDPEKLLAARRRIEMVRAAIDEMPDSDFIVDALITGLDNDALSAKYGQSYGTVAVRKNRAKSALVAKLAKIAAQDK
jgi:DNA-directed RNA polymerase specialized sigma24 family protein